ncbi:MAG: rhodanese-like domain-containing protein [Pseudohongiellaceae bacterium]
MQSLSREELKQMNEVNHEDFVLINVLPQEKFLEKHIRTSINVPVDDSSFSQKVADVAGDKQRKVVVYCANFDCDASSRAADALDKSGFTQVYDYAGGTEDWFNATG